MSKTTRSNTRSHPNRNKKGGVGTIPSPEAIKDAREKVGLTQTQAATLVHSKLRSWQQWEASRDEPTHRRMHPAFFELFMIKAQDEKAIAAVREVA